MPIPKMADLLVTVGAEDVVADINMSIKLSDDEVEASYRGLDWMVRDYGKSSLEVEGEAHPVWSGSGSGGVGLTHAWFRYLMVSKLTKVLVDTSVATPIVILSGDMKVGDVEESADDPEFETFSYSLLSAGEMAFNNTVSLASGPTGVGWGQSASYSARIV